MLRRTLTPLSFGLLSLASLSAILSASQNGGLLVEAAMRDEAATVRTLLQQGADVNAAQGDGMTALHWAALKGDEALAGVLLGAGAHVEAVTRIDAQTPLHMAAAAGQAALIRTLSSAGAHVDATTTAGTTPLMMAAAAGSVEAVKVLLGHGAAVNQREHAKQHTALMFAAAANRAEVVKALLDGGADATAMTAVFDLTHVEMSVDRTLQNYALTLVRRAETAAKNKDGKPAVAGLDRGYEYNELVGAQGGLTPLLFAAREGHAETVKVLLDAGVDVNGVSGSVQASPLLVAVVNGHFDLALSLLQHGANPNLAAENGVAPLYAALNCQWSPQTEYPQPQAGLQQRTTYLELVTALLDRGADANRRLKKKVWYTGYSRDNSGVDEAGATPFWRAAFASDVEAMRLLVAHGADPQITTTGPRTPAGAPGATPLHAASGDGFLQDYAGNGHRTHPAGWLPAVTYLVEEIGADVNAKDGEGNTPLHYAAARGDNVMLRYLISKGGDPKAVNRRGQTTVDAANGPRQRVQPFPETIKLLEGLGAKNNHKCVSC